MRHRGRAERIHQLRCRLEDLRAKRPNDLDLADRILEEAVAELKADSPWPQMGDEDHSEGATRSQDGIWAFDLQGTTTFVNQTVAKMMGYSPAEMVGRSFSSFLAGDCKEAARKIFYPGDQGSEERKDQGRKLSLEPDQTHNLSRSKKLDHESNNELNDEPNQELCQELALELELIRKDGKSIFARLVASPLFASSGEVCSHVAQLARITENRDKMEELRESEDFLMKIINSIGDPIFVKDREHRYVLTNDALRSFVGRSAEQMIGKRSSDLYPAEQADIFLQKDEEVFRTGKENVNEEMVTDASGTVRTVVTRKTLYRDRKGRDFLVGIARDITDRKQAEEALHRARDDLERRVSERTAELEKAIEALRKSKDYLDKIINSIGDPIFVKDRMHRLVLVNDAACRLFGRPREDITGRTAYDLFPADQAKISWEKDEVVFVTREENVNEETNTYASGVIRTVLVKKTPYRDEAGNHFLVGVTRDITDRKQAEEAQKESERRLADIIDFLPDATLVIDKTGRVIAWNHAIEAMTGIMAKDILGKGSNEYSIPFYGERRPILIDLVLHPVETIEKRYDHIERMEGALEGEAYMPNMKGGAIYLYGKAAVLYDSLGNVFGAIESIRDITARKHAEEELQKAKEAAEEAARAKAEFLANMSHEIRTPLNAVVGLTGLLLTADLTSDQRDYVETIRSSGNSLLSVINDILDFSKIEGGKMELEAQPVDLAACIKEAVDLLAGTAAQKRIELSYSLEEGVPQRIQGDVTRLRQVLVNLLGNAVKFTERGSVAVLVSGKALEGDGDWFEVHFAVKDTGIGIPAERLDRLFLSFSQIDSSITRKYGGTGLGLAISRRLVEMMGGRIWVESALGKGSTFHFAIPARPTDKETVRSSAAPTPTPTTTPAITSAPALMPSHAGQRPGEMRKLRILLAEDNGVNQKVALHMLRRLGYQADVAANGLEVLQALESRSYDVILMDIQMPEMDGIEATRRIRERWPDRGPKIIAITAYALEGDRERFLSAGMDEYISKPIQMDELRSVLEACN